MGTRVWQWDRIRAAAGISPADEGVPGVNDWSGPVAAVAPFADALAAATRLLRARVRSAGFRLKDTPPVGPLQGIGVVAAGEALLSPSARHRIEESVRRPDSSPSGPVNRSGVTEREGEVRLVARGWSNAQIADTLDVTAATVKTRVSRLRMKLGLRDRARFVVTAYDSGLVRVGNTERR